ncbi:MAG TPA: cytochrome c [Bryobacteraceae bacterium]|nr:cytochrome c [Bryobacteraceae bacterium]
MKPASVLLLALAATAIRAEGPTMRQLMLDLIHPASNEIQVFVNRGAPTDEAEWGRVRSSALMLAESGKLLALPDRVPKERAEWTRDADALAEIGTKAYQAAQAKDFAALAALTESLDASCTNCHKQFRPNVFPRKGAAEGNK